VASWSISTEFYTYAVFAACLVGFRKHAWIALLLAMIGGPVLIATLSEHNMNTHYDWGIVRCVYGLPPGRWRGTFTEMGGRAREMALRKHCRMGMLGLVVVFVSVAGTTLLSIAAPYVFALVVLVFAFEAGAASAVLRLRP